MMFDQSGVVIVRGPSDADSTPGQWFWDGYYACNTVEDVRRAPGQKVYGKTCIPAGRYLIKLRTEGGFHRRAQEKSKIKDIHKGMLWLRMPDGPNQDDEVASIDPATGHMAVWKWILVHWGNTHLDTDGCILLGQSPPAFLVRHRVDRSVDTYCDVVPLVTARLIAGQDVPLTIIDPYPIAA